MIDWREMELFQGIDLNDSFVLHWDVEPHLVVFELEASLWPESEFYRTPKKGDYTCYRTARLMFRDYDSISGLFSMNDVKPTVGPDNMVDYGNIDSLYQEGAVFRVYGDFGEVEIRGGSLGLEFNET
jgi:hypothetical protein